MSNLSYQISDYLVQKLVEHFTGIGLPFSITSLYMALLDQGAELSGSGYKRAEIKFGPATSVAKDLTSEVRNNEKVMFDTPTSTWNADGFRIYDAQQEGNLLFDGDFEYAIEVTSSKALTLEKGWVRLSLGTDHWTPEAQERALNVAFAGGSYRPAGLYVALLTSEPKIDVKKKTQLGRTKLNELSGNGNGYARQQVISVSPPSPPYWSFQGGSATSKEKTTFSQATEDWDAFVASALVDAQQDGIVIGWDTNDAIEVLDGDDVEIDAGAASLSF